MGKEELNFSFRNLYPLFFVKTDNIYTDFTFVEELNSYFHF